MRNWITVVQVLVLGLLVGGLLEQSGWLPRLAGWGAGGLLVLVTLVITLRPARR